LPDWINDITQLRAGTLNLQGFCNALLFFTVFVLHLIGKRYMIGFLFAIEVEEFLVSVLTSSHVVIIDNAKVH
jgi:hypothetical protein